VVTIDPEVIMNGETLRQFAAAVRRSAMAAPRRVSETRHLVAAVRRYAEMTRRPWRDAASEPSPALRAAAGPFPAAGPEPPRLANGRLRRLGVLDPDRREEHVQNALVLTWHRYRTAALKGTAHPGLLRPMLWYSVQHNLTPACAKSKNPATGPQKT